VVIGRLLEEDGFVAVSVVVFESLVVELLQTGSHV